MDDKRGVIGAFCVMVGVVALIPLFQASSVQIPALMLVLLASVLGMFATFSLQSVYKQANNGFIENNDPRAMAFRRAVINRWRQLTGNPPILVLPASKSQYMTLRDAVDVYWRRLIGKPPLPTGKISFDERQMADHANVVIFEIKEALSKSPISSERKRILMRQVRLFPQSITEAMWRLYRLRNLQGLPYAPADLKEVKDMENSTLALMRNSIGELMLMPLNLMRIEVARADAHADRFIAEVREINERLRDQYEAHTEAREASWQRQSRSV